MLTKKLEDQAKESARIEAELAKIRQEKEDALKKIQTQEKAVKKAKPELEEKPKAEEPKPEVVEKKVEDSKKESEKEKQEELDPKAEGELGLISTVLGCRENRDRIEFAHDLKEFVLKQDMTEEQKKEAQKSHLGLASDYKLVMSKSLVGYIKGAQVAVLAKVMPKYEFISPSLALIIMGEIRKMLRD